MEAQPKAEQGGGMTVRLKYKLMCLSGIPYFHVTKEETATILWWNSCRWEYFSLIPVSERHAFEQKLRDAGFDVVVLRIEA